MRFNATTVTVACLLAAASAPALAQNAPGQYGQRVGNTYLPSTRDTNCVGVLCASPPPVDPASPTGAPLPPPPCEGLLCSLTPYGMQRPYTAAEAAEVERQRAAAQAQQAAAAPREPAAPVRHPRKRRKAVAKATPKPVPAQQTAARAAPPAPAKAATRSPAPFETVQ